MSLAPGFYVVLEDRSIAGGPFKNRRKAIDFGLTLGVKFAVLEILADNFAWGE